MISLRTIIVAISMLITVSAFGQTVVPVSVSAGLAAAIDFANNNPGAADVLELTDANGVYDLGPVEILYPITIRSADPANPATIAASDTMDLNDWITVDEDLTMEDVIVDGQSASGAYSKFKYVFKVNNPIDASPINEAPELRVTNCTVRNVYRNGDPVNDVDGNIFDISTGSYAAVVHFENTTLENTGDEAIRSINAHKAPVHPNGTAIGSLVIRNCTFNNINGSAIKVESDGDSTTYDGELIVENVTFYNCLRRVIWERDWANSIYHNILIVNSKTGNDNFGGTDALISAQRAGSIITNIDTFNIEGVKGLDTVRLGNQPFKMAGGDWSNSSDKGDVEWTEIYGHDPMFADAANGDFTLLAGSKIYTLGHDGGAIGDRRWATNPPSPKVEIQVTVAAGLNAAIDFANNNPGAADVLVLSDPNGVYDLGPVEILYPLTIRSADPANPATIAAMDTIDQNDFITVDEDLTMRDVIVDGQGSSGAYAKFKYMFKVNNPPDASPINPAPRLRVENCLLRNVYANGDPVNDQDGSFFDVSLTAYAGSLHFEKVTFENSGDEGIRSINAHKTPVHPTYGAFGALIIRDCTFNNINGSAIKIESDGDSTTIDAPVLIENVTFYQCLRRVIWERDFEFSEYRNLLIVDSKTGNDTFGGTDALASMQRFGTVLSHVDTFAIQGIKAGGDTVTLGPEPFRLEAGSWSGAAVAGTVKENTIYNLDPMFVDPANGNFEPMNSALYTLAHDGGLIGDRHFGMMLTGISDDTRTSSLPKAFTLEQNYPNPFNPETTIQYSLQKQTHVKLEVYNILGALVETLVDEVRPVGEYRLTWDAAQYASGVYFYRLSTANNTLTKKMMLLK